MGSNKSLYQKYVMSKYKAIVLEILESNRFLSTNGVVRKVKTEHGKNVNWYLIYHVLKELETEGKIEKVETEHGFMWKRKRKVLRGKTQVEES
jgi:Fe2+ or Zn2+ uptake regulation protein